MRLFVALEIPDDARVGLRALIETLRPVCPTARWVRIENAHVTLKFIGEASVQKLQEIKNALAPIKIPTPIQIDFRGVGFFPNPKRPRVFWAGINAEAKLATLAGTVKTSLENLGIEKETRAFSPHITLAQFNAPSHLKQLQQAIKIAGPLDFGSTAATEFHLYQSVLKPAGAEYTRLATFRFAEGGPQ